MRCILLFVMINIMIIKVFRVDAYYEILEGKNEFPLTYYLNGKNNICFDWAGIQQYANESNYEFGVYETIDGNIQQVKLLYNKIPLFQSTKSNALSIYFFEKSKSELIDLSICDEGKCNEDCPTKCHNDYCPVSCPNYNSITTIQQIPINYELSNEAIVSLGTHAWNSTNSCDSIQKKIEVGFTYLGHELISHIIAVDLSLLSSKNIDLYGNIPKQQIYTKTNSYPTKYHVFTNQSNTCIVLTDYIQHQNTTVNQDINIDEESNKKQQRNVHNVTKSIKSDWRVLIIIGVSILIFSLLLRHQKQFFYQLGYYIALYPKTVLCLTFILIVSFIPGIFMINNFINDTETGRGAVPVWIPNESSYFKAYDEMVEISGGKFRSPRRSIFIVKHSNDIIQHQYLRHLLLLHNKIMNIKVEFNDQVYNFENLCWRASIKDECEIRTVLKFWNYQLNILNNDTNLHKTIGDMKTPQLSFLASNNIGGGIYNDIGEFIRAKSLLFSYALKTDTRPIVPFSGTSTLDEVVYLWELEFERLLKDEKVNDLLFYYSTSRTLDRETSKAAGNDIYLVGAQYVITILYAMYGVSYGMQRRPTPRRLFVAFMGVCEVVFAWLISIGIAGYFNILITAALPLTFFITVAVGLDDTFLMIARFDTIKLESFHKTRSEKVGTLMCDVMPTVFVTNLTNICGFALAIALPVPVLQSLGLLLSLTFIFDLLLQSTQFVAVLSLVDSNQVDSNHVDSNQVDSNHVDSNQVDSNHVDSNQVDSNQVDSEESEKNTIELVHPRLSTVNIEYLEKISKVEDKENKSAIDDLINSKYYKLLNNRVFHLLVFLFVVLSVSYSISVVMNLDIDDSPNKIFAKDSQISQIQQQIQNDYEGDDVYYVIIRNTSDLSITKNQKMLDDLYTTLKRLQITGTHAKSWYHSYRLNLVSKLNDNSLYNLPYSRLTYQYYLEDWLYNSWGSVFNSSIILHREEKCSSSQSFYFVSHLEFPIRNLNLKHTLQAVKDLFNEVSAYSDLDIFLYADTFFRAALHVQVLESIEFTFFTGICVIFLISIVVLRSVMLACTVSGLTAIVFLQVLGIMKLSGIPFNIIVSFFLISSISLSCDYSIHVAFAFYETKSIPSSLAIVKTPIFMSALSSLFGVSVLVFSESALFQSYFVVFISVIMLGLFNALILMPLIFRYCYSVNKSIDYKSDLNDSTIDKSNLDVQESSINPKRNEFNTKESSSVNFFNFNNTKDGNNEVKMSVKPIPIIFILIVAAVCGFFGYYFADHHQKLPKFKEIHGCDEEALFYQTVDGSCNSLKYPAAGRFGSSFSREIDNTVGSTRLGPNSRQLSNIFFRRKQFTPNRNNISGILVGYIQFILHDWLYQRDNYTHLIDIDIPTCDIIFDPECSGTKTFKLPTANFINNVGDTPNYSTHWLDLSTIYGSTYEVHKEIRSWKDGKIRMSNNGKYLPKNNGKIKMNGKLSQDQLYLAGDDRANSNVLLLSFHILFAREHNRLCDELKLSYPDYNDQLLFQTARAINVLQLHRITREYIEAYGFDYRYISEKDPNAFIYFETRKPFTVPQEYTIAYRWHSLIPENIKIYNSTHFNSFSLAKLHYNISVVENYGIGNILRGLSETLISNFGSGMPDFLRNHKFYNLNNPKVGHGIDVAAFSIERERLRGLSTFNRYRELLGLRPHDNFADFTSDSNLITNLSVLYATPDDVDLSVGLEIEEGTFKDSILPETMIPLVLSTVVRSVAQDRFGLSALGQTTSITSKFSGNRIMNIARLSLADIIRRNTNISCLPKKTVFKVSNPHNNPIICK